MKTFASILCLSVSLATVAVAQEPLNQNFPDPATRSIPTGRRDGFFVQDNKVFMVRDGVTTLVDREILFPNGLRVLPNATVTLRDGRETTLLTKQWLNFEGSIDDTTPVILPQRPVAVQQAEVRETGVSARDGITISGTDVFITRDGKTEKITSEMHLKGGVIVHPDGTVQMAHGKKVMLRSEQVLGFDGVIREAPVRPTPANAEPSPANPAR